MKMKAVLIDKPGVAEVLKIGETPVPVPKEDEILVKVHAAALNRADIMQREGKYPPPSWASEILGLEMAGDVYALGNKVTKWKKGEKVFGLLPGGGYAEFAIINERMANKIPSNLSYEAAAAISEVFLTAYQAVVWHSKLQKDENILVHAGASGVGTAAIQIAKTIGAKIFATASKKKHKLCLELGAEKTIDYKQEDFADRINEFTKGKGVNVIIDFIAGPYFMQNLKSLSLDGRLIMLATLGGTKFADADIRHILMKRLTVIGSTLRSRTREYQVKLNKDFMNFALEKFENGTLKPVIDKVIDWIDVQEAHRYMEANKNTGKIVLKISG
jgi:putative PIG3 family NAD(P)H quinone oxidoreductase